MSRPRSRLAERYWASLTDARPEELDRLIEHGRRRDLPLWRRYVASLLDAPVTVAVPFAGEAVGQPRPTALVRPTSTVSYDLDATVDVRTDPPAHSRWRRGASFVLAAVLVIVTMFGVSFGASRWLAEPRLVSPAVSGYRTVEDPAGYTVAVPKDWTRRQQEGEKAPVVFYDSPDDGRQLQIFEVAESTPAASLDLAETDPGYGFARQPGYLVLDRTSGRTWAELTYQYDDVDKGPREVIDHRFEAADGTIYVIRDSGPEPLPLAFLREPLEMAVRFFCPAKSDCSSTDSG